MNYLYRTFLPVLLGLLLSLGLFQSVAFANSNGTAGMVNGVIDGTTPPGGTCTADINCEDVNGQSYGCYPEGGGTCTLNGDAPVGSQSVNQTAPGVQSANQTAPGVQSANQTSPGVQSVSQTQTSGTGLQNPLNAPDLPTLLNEVLGYVIQLGTIALTVMLVYVGFLFVAARGNSEGITKARQALVWTVIGGLLLLGAQALSLVIQSTIQAL